LLLNKTANSQHRFSQSVYTRKLSLQVLVMNPSAAAPYQFHIAAEK
jgi:hypothetical protein